MEKASGTTETSENKDVAGWHSCRWRSLCGSFALRPGKNCPVVRFRHKCYHEFNVQNNTVQAQLDKAKQRFEDITIELGEQLIPATKYAISTLSVGVHVLSTLITFTVTHAKQLAVIGSAIAVCTALWYKETIAIKLKATATTYAAAIDKAYIATTNLLRAAMVALQATWAYLTKGVQGYIVVMRAARLASLTNPWAALATVLTMVGVTVY